MPDDAQSADEVGRGRMATVYHPTAGKVDEIEVTPRDIKRGVAPRICPACCGTGIFQGPDFESPCVECSTRGRVMVIV